jgi:hypothetical protein
LLCRLQQAHCALAQGFLDFRRNGLRPGGQTLEMLHLSCLGILSRLFVLFYAEETQLLPATANSAYGRYYSLKALAEQVRSGEAASDPAQTTLWGRLRRLWQLLAEGRPDLGVPRVASWLFMPQAFPFLEQYRLGDDVVCRMLEWLADIHLPAERSAGPIMWGARRYAGVYGGLLDYRLHFATGPLTVRKEVGGRRLLMPEEAAAVEGEFEDVAIEAGAVFLLSRYAGYQPLHNSPQDSEGIIRRTLEPVLRGLGVPTGKGQFSAYNEEIVQRFLSLRIVDPTVHAGQMLLDIAGYLSAWLARIMPDAEEAEGDWRRQCLTTCLSGLTLDPAGVHVAALTIALESDPTLAAENLPQIRIGNPLFGVRLPELLADSRGHDRRRRAAVGMEQLSIWEAGATEEFQEWQSEVAGKLPWYRQLADIWVAGRVALPVSRDAWRGLVNLLLHGGLPLPQLVRLQQEAGLLAEREHFFHPELSLWESFTPQDGGPQVVFLGDPLRVEWLLEEFRGRAVPARVAELERIVRGGREAGQA